MSSVQITGQVHRHALHLFYPSTRLAWRFEPGHTIRDLGRADHLWLGGERTDGLCRPWLPPAWRAALTDRYDDVIWSQDQDPDCSSDLLSSVHKLCGGAAVGPSRLYAPSDKVGNDRLSRLLDGRGLWLEGQRGDGRRRLMLTFSKAAQGRLAAAGHPCAEAQLLVDKPRLFQFESDVAILDLPVRISLTNADPSVPAAVLAEALHALARINSLCWSEPSGARSATFSLGDIARTLLEGPYGSSQPQARVYSAAFAALRGADGNEGPGNLATALAKHYTEDYRFAAGSKVAAERLHPFGGVHRVAALEGCAVVIEDQGDAIEFVDRYYETAFRPAYLPLALLSRHEGVAWRQLAEEMPAWSQAHGEKPAQIAALKDLRNRAINVRLKFGLPCVSTIADQELWKQALDQSQGLPALRATMIEETAAIEMLVAADHREMLSAQAERSAQRQIWISALAAGGVVAASVFGVVKDLIAPNFEKQNWHLWSLQFAPVATVALMVGAAAGLVAFSLVLKRLSGRSS